MSAVALEPSIIGSVVSVRGSRAKIGLFLTQEKREKPTVGSLLAMQGAGTTLVGVVTQVDTARSADLDPSMYSALAQVDLTGEMTSSTDGRTHFQHGVRIHPGIGDTVSLLSSETMQVIYGTMSGRSVRVGQLTQAPSVPAILQYENLLTKHFAVVGSTGVGKSSGVAVIVDGMIKTDTNLRVLILDTHNEYGRSFGDKAYVSGSTELRLPFWMFNLDEMTDVIYGGRPGVDEEIDTLSELIPLAKSMYQNYKASADRPGLTRRAARHSAFTADTPAPYVLQDLISLIDERMGKLENRANRMVYRRLMGRLELIKNDPRYGFMFENANVGGDTMAAVLGKLFRLEEDHKQVTVLRLGSLPGEAVDAVVCVVLRLAFEFGVWSDGALPLLVVCEEAHRYAAADQSIGFGPARRSLSRIAKEGRKYGVHLALVSQRPAELDPTIISQCSSIFAMRMTNEQDQALLKSASADVADYLLDMVPTLGTGEVIGIGEAMPLSTRFSFEHLPAGRLPSSEMAATQPDASSINRPELVRTVVERWRRATVNQAAEEEGPTLAPDAMERPSLLKAPLGETQLGGTRLLDQTRSSILKR